MIIWYLAKAWGSEGKEIKPVATIKIGDYPPIYHISKVLCGELGNWERRQASGKS
jgi:hypothetical protein